jgi:integrase/recombinase XerD
MANAGKARVLTKAQFDHFMDESAKTHQAELLQCVACLGYYAGLRVGTIAQLSLNDVIDYDGKVKEVVHLSGDIMKGGKQSVAYFSHPRLISAITTYVRNSRKTKKVANLLVTRKNTAYTPKSLSALIEKKFKDYGFSGCSMHSFRRSFASQVINKGGDITLLRSLMNHSSITTTAIYVENDPIALQRMVNTLD